ncbi:hypothetical protein LIER_09190 [Lithospermum erythrorhizon]|uniref:Uncharacterized protein n=1 Tax=Lithospermum erythrorhizon TaxID=34254 RepID=A0AAV3PGZ5_LITER
MLQGTDHLFSISDIPLFNGADQNFFNESLQPTDIPRVPLHYANPHAMEEILISQEAAVLLRFENGIAITEPVFVHNLSTIAKYGVKKLVEVICAFDDTGMLVQNLSLPATLRHYHSMKSGNESIMNDGWNIINKYHVQWNPGITSGIFTGSKITTCSKSLFQMVLEILCWNNCDPQSILGMSILAPKATSCDQLHSNLLMVEDFNERLLFCNILLTRYCIMLNLVQGFLLASFMETSSVAKYSDAYRHKWDPGLLVSVGSHLCSQLAWTEFLHSPVHQRHFDSSLVWDNMNYEKTELNFNVVRVIFISILWTKLWDHRIPINVDSYTDTSGLGGLNMATRHYNKQFINLISEVAGKERCFNSGLNILSLYLVQQSISKEVSQFNDPLISLVVVLNSAMWVVGELYPTTLNMWVVIRVRGQDAYVSYILILVIQPVREQRHLLINPWTCLLWVLFFPLKLIVTSFTRVSKETW